MKFKHIIYTGHGIQRLFERDIDPDDIEQAVITGQIIEEYPEDKHSRVFFMINHLNGKPVHIVVSFNNKDETVYLITAYFPDTTIWDETFLIRRTK